METTAEPKPTYRQVLADRRLATLLTGDTISKVGDGMAVVALPLLALKLHGTVPRAVAIALVTAAPQVLPVFLSLTFGLGRRRFDPRRVLLADATLRSVVFIALGALSAWLELWSLTVALFAGSVLRLLSSSSRRLLATRMAGSHGRLAVNGLLGTIDSMALYVVGPVLGGVLASVISPATVIFIDGLTFLGLLLAVVTAVPRDLPQPAPVADKATEEDTGAQRSRSGWTVMRQAPVALWLLVMVFLFDLFYGPVEVALPLLVTDALRSGGGALGIIWTSFGFGAFLGALLTNQLRRAPQRLVLLTSVGGWAACVAILAMAPNVAVAAAAFAIGGLVYGPFVAVAYTLMQDSLSEEDQQPVFTVWAAGTAVAGPLGLAIAGPIVNYAGTRPSLWISAAVTAALVPVAARLLRRT